MFHLRRSWLAWAALLAAAGYAIGRWRETTSGPVPAPSGPSLLDEDVSPATAEENRIDALVKLKTLRDEGVLTQEQYESERERLTQGIS